ncbi:uncharacterized protein LOC131310793 [Rhododendron vialii]|uniref:uncharacterized protein LOC131310793 n=1 Tax=Rhododendron vialii TaxID=182163 RepID=UPI00265D6258|nr:uncharacterized protein LOC131310793 [Rhododendron vialii]
MSVMLLVQRVIYACSCVFIGGGGGPSTGGCYGQIVDLDKLKDFHRRRLQVLVEAGPDLLAFEAIPNKLEAQSFTLSLDLGTLDLFRPALTHLHQQGIKEPLIRQAKMDVDALLNEKMKTKNKCNLKIINIEWGAFSTGIPLTQFDRDMDAASINSGEQIFEKTISDMYLGEIVRRVLLKMADASDLFGESNMEKFSTQFVLRLL